MHRTLKAQTSRPPAANAAEQQKRFDTFRLHYNEERPHELVNGRRTRSTRHRGGKCRIASRCLGTMPSTKFGACAARAR